MVDSGYGLYALRLRVSTHVKLMLFSYDTLGPENITYVLDHSQVQNMFCSKAAVETLMKTPKLGILKTIICFDKLPAELIAKITEKGITYIDF